MTIDYRAARALKRARLLLRDAAAADRAIASTADHHARSAVDTRQQVLDATVDAAAVALADANSVLALDAIGAAVADDRYAIEVAVQDQRETSAAAERAAGVLRSRIRELRTSERVVERLDRDRATARDRAEQKAADDRAGRRGT